MLSPSVAGPALHLGRRKAVELALSVNGVEVA